MEQATTTSLLLEILQRTAILETQGKAILEEQGRATERRREMYAKLEEVDKRLAAVEHENRRILPLVEMHANDRAESRGAERVIKSLYAAGGGVAGGAIAIGFDWLRAKLGF